MASITKNRFLAYAATFFERAELLTGRGRGSLTDILWNQRARLRGVCPSARLPVAVQPANLDTIGIGALTIEISTAAPPVASNPAYTAVGQGANAAATLANLVDALNGVVDATRITPGTTALPSVLADAVGTSLRLRLADAPGGYPVFDVSGTLALAAALNGAPAWSVANLNATGRQLEKQDVSYLERVVSAAEVTEGHAYFELDFVPASVAAFGGEQAAFSIGGPDNKTVIVAMSDGVNPYFQAGETIRALALA